MRRLWIAPFLVYTRGDPAADPDVALVRSVLAAMPGGLLLHLWLPLLGATAALASFIVCKFSDPGVVHSDNAQALTEVRRSALPPACSLLRPAADCCCQMYGLSSHGTAGRCSQCGVAPRPARTHHCRTCGACVFRFDHHCYWMGVCIGARNLRWFLAFVLAQGLTYLYGVLFLSAALWTAYRYPPTRVARLLHPLALC